MYCYWRGMASVLRKLLWCCNQPIFAFFFCFFLILCVGGVGTGQPRLLCMLAKVRGNPTLKCWFCQVIWCFGATLRRKWCAQWQTHLLPPPTRPMEPNVGRPKGLGNISDIRCRICRHWFIIARAGLYSAFSARPIVAILFGLRVSGHNNTNSCDFAIYYSEIHR